MSSPCTFEEIQQMLDYAQNRRIGADTCSPQNGSRGIKIKLVCDCDAGPKMMETIEEVICEECGRVFEHQMVSHSDETQNYNSEDGAQGSAGSRCGGSEDPLFPCASSRLHISNAGGGAAGRMLQKLNLWMAMTYEEKNIIEEKQKLERRLYKHNVPNYILRRSLFFFKDMDRTRDADGKKQIHR